MPVQDQLDYLRRAGTAADLAPAASERCIKYRIPPPEVGDTYDAALTVAHDRRDLFMICRRTVSFNCAAVSRGSGSAASESVVAK